MAKYTLIPSVGLEGALTHVQEELRDDSAVGGVELILSDVEVVFSSKEVEDVSEIDLGLSGSEFDVSVGLVSDSGVSKVDVMPLSQVLLVRDSLPIVTVSSSVQIIIGVGGKGQNVFGLRSSNPVTKDSVSETSDVLVVLSVID